VSFQIHALGPARFAPLFRQSNAALAGAKAIKKTVDANPGYPFRVSLHDAIPAMLNDTNVAYLHLHNAKLGCFLARVTRT